MHVLLGWGGDLTDQELSLRLQVVVMRRRIVKEWMVEKLSPPKMMVSQMEEGKEKTKRVILAVLVIVIQPWPH